MNGCSITGTDPSRNRFMMIRDDGELNCVHAPVLECADIPGVAGG
jgi:hypothetical protein